MELAKTLLKIWALRVWIAIGLVLAVLAAAASLTMAHTKVYSAASTQMLVDSPRSALGDPAEDLTPFTARAFVFARLMTTPEALQYIGEAAGVPGNLIAASGPTELAGPQATHAPTAAQSGELTSAPAGYKLNFLQNPQLPTVDVYAEAPNTKQAIALANGAVTGFAAYLKHLDSQGSVPVGQRLAIRQVGAATGGTVDPGAGKALAAIIFIVVLTLWCILVLFVSNVRAQLRIARAHSHLRDDDAAVAHAPLAPDVDGPLNLADVEELSPDVGFGQYAVPRATSRNGTGDSGEVGRRPWPRPVAGRFPDD
jgi:hypothetical protein